MNQAQAHKSVILSDQRESKDLRFRMPTLYYELKGRHAGTNRNK